MTIYYLWNEELKILMEKKKYDLEERLINYSTSVIDIIHTLNNDRVNHHLSNQLIRSSTSVSLHYGEA